MVRVQTNMRIAESQVDIDGAAVTTRLIDFNLAVNQGLQILGVLGTWGQADHALAAAAGEFDVLQTLHLNDDVNTLEDPAWGSADTSHGDIDSEIFFELRSCILGQEDDVNHTDSASPDIGPMMWLPPGELFTMRSISHRGEGFNGAGDMPGRVKIYYRYVIMSADEQVLLLGRRR